MLRIIARIAEPIITPATTIATILAIAFFFSVTFSALLFLSIEVYYIMAGAKCKEETGSGRSPPFVCFLSDQALPPVLRFGIAVIGCVIVPVVVVLVSIGLKACSIGSVIISL